MFDREIEKAERCERAFRRKWKIKPEQSYCNGAICVVSDNARTVVEMYDMTAARVRSLGFLVTPEKLRVRPLPN